MNIYVDLMQTSENNRFFMIRIKFGSVSSYQSTLETGLNVSVLFSRLSIAYKNTLSFPPNFCISSVCNTQEKLKTMGTGCAKFSGGDKMC